MKGGSAVVLDLINLSIFWEGSFWRGGLFGNAAMMGVWPHEWVSVE